MIQKNFSFRQFHFCVFKKVHMDKINIANNKNNDKENKFVCLVRICLAKHLFDFLFNSKKQINDNNLLFCCKNLTNIFIPLFIKNKKIIINVAIQWSEKKRNLVKHLLINDDSHLKYILSFINLIQLTFSDDFNQELTFEVLPSKLSQLTFGWHFNQPIACGVLPPSGRALLN